ncbi:integrin beta-1-like [Polymixia lowei]
MAVKLLSLCLLLGLLCPSWAEKQTCPSTSTCRECIQAGPGCAWCTDPDLPKNQPRCHAQEELQKAGCGERHIYHPQGSVLVVRNDSRTESAEAVPVFLQPQVMKLSLRPGVRQSFPLTVTLAKDQPFTELTLETSPIPAGVNITFNQISTAEPLVIQVNVEATGCPSGNGSWTVQITPRGVTLSLELQLTFECLCDCMKVSVENSPVCSGQGALMCGRCNCNEPYIGHRCQKNGGSLFSLDDRLCRSDPNSTVCSGRGDCIYGECECHRRENPEERYSGRFCECSNFDCPRSNNRMCGGHGRCICGQCLCDVNWIGDACSCSMETASCRATNQQLCNGRGMCICGACRCDPSYAGPTCESCPFCLGVCHQDRDCVECLAFGMGMKKDSCEEECGSLTLTKVESKTHLPQPGETSRHCKMRDADSCIFYYSVSITPSGRHVTVAQAKECPTGLWQ